MAPLKTREVMSESVFIDTIIERALLECTELPEDRELEKFTGDIQDLNERLSGGRLRIAVLGQFNRGKSSFINTLLGLEVLPISVLPITSVPTVITHGSKNICTIKFSDEKENIQAEENTEAIVNLLNDYVSEKNNPRNSKNVSGVTVATKSDFLHHGTVLIDTPGFGSTNIHNTETTIELLTSCDAALFLLSADLPITEVEIEFLKKVIPVVPRIFFIYNKTDLLGKDELEETQSFIKQTLMKDLEISIEPTLFPVSVKKANKKREESGFDLVEEEIINFLLKEKYFTLSQALTSKLNSSLEGIINNLKKKLEDLLIPIHTAEDHIAILTAVHKDIEDSEKKAESKYLSEEESIDKLFRISAEQKLKDTEIKTDKKLKQILSTAAQSRQSYHDIIETTLTTFLEEYLNRTTIEFTALLSKPITTAGFNHIKNLKNVAERTFSKLDVLVDIDDMYDPLMEKATLNLEDYALPQIDLSLLKPVKPLYGRFTNIDKRIRVLNEHYSQSAAKLVKNSFHYITDFVSSHTTKIFEKFYATIREDYDNLLANINGRINEAEETLEEKKNEVSSKITELEELIKKFKEIKDLVI